MRIRAEYRASRFCVVCFRAGGAMEGRVIGGKVERAIVDERQLRLLVSNEMVLDSQPIPEIVFSKPITTRS
jgi:hypothetical protein